MTALPLTRTKRTWLASLELDLTSSAFGTQLTRTKRQGPLSVQKAFYPEGRDCAHLYLLHPPAGIVSGDDLTVTINLSENARSLITTPGANRFYRAREDEILGDSKQAMATKIQLSDKASCEYFPLESIVYEDANAFNYLDIHLTTESGYMGWDVVCLGLPSASQPFERGRLNQRTRIYCEQKLIYHDRFAIHPDSKMHQHPAGLHDFSVYGTFLAYLPDHIVNNEEIALLLQNLRNRLIEKSAQDLVSITYVNKLMVMRYLGFQAEQCKEIYIALWELLRPVCMEKNALVPRIWHT